MFWGLELEPEKKYNSIVDKSFHVSMASLHPVKCHNDGYTSFMFCQETKNFILCNLHRDKAVQVQLDLNFQAGEPISFLTTGARNKVYLSGYIIDEDELDDNMDLYEESESGDEVASPANALKRKKTQLQSSAPQKVAKLDDESESTDDENDDAANVVDSDEDSSEEEGSDEEVEESDEEEEPAPLAISPPKMQQKKKKKENIGTPQQKQHGTPQSNGKTPKSEKKNKQQGTPTGAKPAPSATPKQTLEGGVIIEDTKVGSGTPAKPGKMVCVYYTGRLKQNNKQFDATTQGPGFRFRMGKGEVIRGWDIGINGMKIGGKRKITIPPALAYGSRGSLPQIPPNAPLVFEVELKAVS